MTKKLITYELDREVALVGLNRPEKRNCLNPEVFEQLHQAVLRAGAEAKCGVIFGHGTNFSAGLDLAWAAENWQGGRSQRLPFPTIHALNEMARGAIPWVAAVHGATVGGGLELAASAHVRVADESAFFGMPEGTRGIFVGGGGSVRIQRLLGTARMTDLMLTGRTLKAEEAERYNLLQYIVPRGQALAKATELARRVSQNAPLSNFAIINSLPRIQDMAYEDGLFVERLVAEYTRSTDSIDRLRSFLDKTAPRLPFPG